MARQATGLRRPKEGDAGSVPSTRRWRPLWRACGRTHPQPWFFSARGAATDPGRFDLTVPAGTCYWALSPAAAIIETTADPDALDPPAIAVSDLARLTIWETRDVPQARRRRLADLTVASLPHLTAEIATVVPYALAWMWTDAFHADGRSGICYRGRFSNDEAVALFGPSGIPDDVPQAIPTPATAHYDDLSDGFKALITPTGDLDAFQRGLSPR